MTVPDTRLKIAVFIDFDNIEIGVKSTLNTAFDIGQVLEALKERGEVVSKIAYSDWKRAGDYSRSLSQHAIKMVQRNLTPGGDKNGADINLALDALEMAFTHPHINAYVIVGGDSDFITLVEKLKQYDKKVLVVGGRSFTSNIMQRNCHEFIAYENLIGVGNGRRAAERGGRAPRTAQAPVEQAIPLVKRALEVLTDREVSPQLGLLKSTLLQLDSTFSERSFGASSFRDFAEKLEAAGLVSLKHAGRNILVELKDGDAEGAETQRGAETERGAETQRGAETHGGGGAQRGRDGQRGPEMHRSAPADMHRGAQGSRDQDRRDHDRQRRGDVPASPEAARVETADAEAPEVIGGIADVRKIFSRSRPARFPMYIRNVKQLLRQTEPGFDERRYGFASLVDLLRAAQREGIVRLERDRQGALRVFQGTQWTQAIDGLPLEDPALEALDVPEESRDTVLSGVAAAEEPDVLLEEASRDTLPPHGEPLTEAAPEKPKRGRGRGRGTRAQAKPESPAQPAKPARARKTARAPRVAKPAAATTNAPRRRTSRKAAATQEPTE